MLSSFRPFGARASLATVPCRYKGQMAKKSKNINVILKKSSPKIGEEGEELNVKRGYARNYLFPQSLAVYATPEAKRDYAEAAARIDYVARARQKALESAQKRLAKVTLKIKRQRLPDDKLHSPVDAKTISTQLWRQFQIDFSPDMILVEEGGINLWGIHPVTVKVGDSGTANINVQVVMR